MPPVELGAPGYPELLVRVADAPRHLYMSGALRATRWVAIVGARAASGAGLERARAVAAALAADGWGIVSGGALGIDAAAHAGALDAGGVTAAVLAGGLDRPSPARNHGLFMDMLAAGGALVSLFAPGIAPRRGHFVRRNRIIAGMAEAVVVVHASAASGSLHTAAAARDYGRVLGAVRGSPGCEALIAEGAAVVETAADVASALADRPRRPVVALPPAGSDEARVLAALNRDAQNEHALAVSTGLGAREVARALIGLELEGLAMPLPGRAYVRSTLAQQPMQQ